MLSRGCVRRCSTVSCWMRLSGLDYPCDRMVKGGGREEGSLSVCLSVYLKVCLSVCLFACLSVHLWVHFFVYLSSVSIHLLFFSIHLLNMYICVCVCLSLSPSLPPSLPLPTYLPPRQATGAPRSMRSMVMCMTVRGRK